MRIDGGGKPQSQVGMINPELIHRAPSGKVYLEPEEGAALHKGNGGERVKELQLMLNASGAQPPLEPDGLFGDKTEAALKKITGSTTIDDAGVKTLVHNIPVVGKDGFGPIPGLNLTGSVGGRMPGTAREVDALELKVASAKSKEAVTLADIKNDPNAFVARCPQLDGDPKTKNDRSACGVASYMAGMVMGNPDSLAQFAGKALNDKGELTPDAKKLFPELDGPGGAKAREALKALNNGAVSPDQMHELTMALYKPMEGRNGAGVAPEDIIDLRARMTKLGVDVPDMEMQRFGPTDGSGSGHWRVAVGNTQYDPWPNKDGKAGIIVGGNPLGDGVAAAPKGETWGNTHKVFLQKHGATINQYGYKLADGRADVKPSDPPPFVVRYGWDGKRQGSGTVHPDALPPNAITGNQAMEYLDKQYKRETPNAGLLGG